MKVPDQTVDGVVHWVGLALVASAWPHRESAVGGLQGRHHCGRGGRGGGEGAVEALRRRTDDVPVMVEEDGTDEEAEVDDCC